MPGILHHSPAEITRAALVHLELGLMPPETADREFSIYFGDEPSLPDEVITVYNTTPVMHVRTAPDNDRVLHHGIQVRVRSRTNPPGYERANKIAIALDKVSKLSITLEQFTYLIHSYTRTTDVIDLGKERPKSAKSPTSERNLFTVNSLVMVDQVTPVPS